MIQRIQSVYLLVVLLINGALPIWLYLWRNAEGTALYAIHELWYALLFFGSATAALTTVFLYKNRKNQFVINRLNILINLVLLGLFIYHTVISPAQNTALEKGPGMLLPAVAIVFLVLANKAIKKDEDLVRSVDRLR